jgi:hypothetical protein
MRIHQAKNIITWAVLTGIAAFGLGTDASPQKVSGTVKDIRGRGVTGAEVTITRTTGTVQATTDREGNFVSIADPMGGTVRITVDAKGFEGGTAEDKAPKQSPECLVSITLLKKHDRPVDSPNSVECQHYTPYSSTPSLRAAWYTADGQFPPDTGALMNFGSQITSGEGKTSTMNVNGSYVFQTSPPVKKPIMILVSPLPDGAVWSAQNQEVLAVTSLTATKKRLEIGKDGDADILIQNAGRTLLRIHLNAHTFSDTWQVEINRVTETGETIWQDGSFGDQ